MTETAPISWHRFYRLCREEMAFRYGQRGIPVDDYKEQFALGRSVSQAAKAIADRRIAYGR